MLPSGDDAVCLNYFVMAGLGENYDTYNCTAEAKAYAASRSEEQMLQSMCPRLCIRDDAYSYSYW